MRSHAKASTAGSTQRQATDLGRFFRGALAGRVSSPGVDGSSASSRRHSLTVPATLALVALLAIAASAPGVASAAEVPTYLSSFGPDGTEGSDFENVNSVAVDQQSGNVYVLEQEAGALYKFDSEGNPVDFGGSAGYISGNRIGGLTVGEAFNKAQVAVDSASHVIYVTEPTAIRAFQQNGEAAEFTAGPGAGSSEIGGFSELAGLAVDGNGNIYAADTSGGAVKIYTSTGEELNQFTAEIPHTLAVDGSGNVYVYRRADTTIVKFTPNEFPVSATTTYAASEPIPMGGQELLFGVGVDPLTGDIYVTKYELGSKKIQQYDEDGTLTREYPAPGEDFELGNFSQGVAVVEGGEAFYLGDLANGSKSAQVAIFGQKSFQPEAPSIESASAREVSADGAKLEAKINPNSVETTYRFEYGTSDCSLPGGACTSLPIPAGSIGSGHDPISVSQAITGLLPATTYHVRVVAENEEGEDEEERLFTTQPLGLAFALGDSRAWELVSPPEKPGGGVAVQVDAVFQAAATGDAFKYTSRGSLEAAPEGNRAPEFSSNLARRSAVGWSSKDVSPPNDKAAPLAGGDLYPLLSPDLSRALLEPKGETPLSSEATEYTPYIRSNTTNPPTYVPLLTEANVAPGTHWGGKGGGEKPFVTGANADLSDIALRSKVPLLSGVPVLPKGGQALYHWADGELEVVSELPAGEGGEVVQGEIGTGIGSIRHAISADGTRIFWSRDAELYGTLKIPALYVRDTEAGESTRLDVVHGGSGAGGATPAFQDATPDGSVVYFTDSQQLTADASPAGRDLYRCELGPDTNEGCAALTDISAPIEGSGESANVKELVPAISEDGSPAYFFAEGVLDTEANGSGEVATAGEPNLYLWKEGQGPRFIATLVPGAESGQTDVSSWGLGAAAPSGRVAALSSYGSPNGRWFTFTSQRSLTGYDNLAPDGTPVEEVFVYDAVSDRLECVSCIPTGAGAVGVDDLRPRTSAVPSAVDIQFLWEDRRIAATLPETPSRGSLGSAFRQPRVVHDNGRVFFNAVDPLVPADTNAQWDVYQYEPLGTGSCSAATGNAALVRSGSGCIGLVSSGRAAGESAFLDADETGNNVFFLTRGKLSVLDVDGEVDVYDARVDGVTATLTPSAECLGEACQPAAIAPNDPTPASAGFKGQGNVRENTRKRCVKGKRQVRRGGKSRCVAKAKKHKRGAQRAGKSGRAGR